MKHLATKKKVLSHTISIYLKLPLAAKQYWKAWIMVNGYIYILANDVIITFNSFAAF